MREALWALDAMDQELTPEHDQAHLRDTVLERMRERPKYWERYYHANGNVQMEMAPMAGSSPWTCNTA